MRGVFAQRYFGKQNLRQLRIANGKIFSFGVLLNDISLAFQLLRGSLLYIMLIFLIGLVLLVCKPFILLALT